MKERKGLFFVILGGILWGTAGVFVRYLEKAGFSSIQMAFSRLTITAILFVVAVFFYNKKLFKIKLKDLWVFICSGLLSVLFFTLCYYETMDKAPVSVAVILLYTAPIFVMIMSCLFFKEKLNAKKVIACVIAFLGCLFISGVIGVNSVPGRAIVTGLLSGFGYALYSIFGRVAINKGYNSVTITMYTFIFASLGSIPFANVGEIPAIINGNFRVFGMAFLFAVINALLPYLFYTIGLTHIESGKASIFASVEPVVATLIGTLFMNEPLDGFGITGIVLVISAVVLLNLKDRKTSSV